MQGEADRPAFTVAICTYNRATSIPDTLRSLAWQTYRNFEVIVVAGPSSDGTDAALEPYRDLLTVLRTDDANLSIARNMAIEHAAGDVVAFIDDDAVAHPRWLSDLANAYREGGAIGGAGGVVMRGNSREPQYTISACRRDGTVLFDIHPPFDQYTRPEADPFIYIQGTNCSFPRTALAEIGGFDENTEYHHDETDVCVRLIDLGHPVTPVSGALVFHMFRANESRGESGIIRNPYYMIKNQYRFAILNAKCDEHRELTLEKIHRFAKDIVKQGQGNFNDGRLSEEEWRAFTQGVDRALAFCTSSEPVTRRLPTFSDQPDRAFQRFERRRRWAGMAGYLPYLRWRTALL